MAKLNNVHRQADALLAELANAKIALAASEAQATREMRQTQDDWQQVLTPLKERVQLLDKQVLSLAKKHRVTLFDGADRVDLPHGALLHTWQESVKKARGVLENLKALGLAEAVKVVESVNWDIMADWPEDRLIAVGTERVRKEIFAYELRDLG